MTNAEIISPDITGRRVIPRSELVKGDVVVFAEAFEGKLRTGLMTISHDESDTFIWAVNLYKGESSEWIFDYAPDEDIIYFEANAEEKRFAMRKAIEVELKMLVTGKNEEERKEATNDIEALLATINATFEKSQKQNI